MPAADEDGASDPLVVAYTTIDEDSNEDRMKANVLESGVVENNCDPMYYELLELKIDYVKGEPLPPFIFDVYDVDHKFIGSDTRDYMGRCIMHVDECAFKMISEAEDTGVDLKPPVPKWHPIRY